jgi:hypothetical protein
MKTFFVNKNEAHLTQAQGVLLCEQCLHFYLRMQPNKFKNMFFVAYYHATLQKDVHESWHCIHV